jgi:hypothetical protein
LGQSSALFALGYFSERVSLFAGVRARPGSSNLRLLCSGDYRYTCTIIPGFWLRWGLSVCHGWPQTVISIFTSQVSGIIDVSLHTWPGLFFPMPTDVISMTKFYIKMNFKKYY